MPEKRSGFRKLLLVQKLYPAACEAQAGEGFGRVGMVIALFSVFLMFT